MRRMTLAANLILFSVVGCASMKAPSPSAPAKGPPVAERSPVAAPSVLPSPTPSAPIADTVAPVQPPISAPVLGPTAPSQPTKPKISPRAAPVIAPVAAAAPRSKGPPAALAAAAPTLNLADLEQRLRDTRAIGVFTKLSLKNQVDDLLDEFRTLYKGPNKQPPPVLRQHYDGLLLKVLSLLQDTDPPLAAAIASSREAIWGILADPEKFSRI
jgi:hypothetical protein